MPPPLSPSRLNDFLGCPHQVALWLAGIKPTEEADATITLIREKGFEHEATVLARLEQLHGPADRIPASGKLEDRVRLTAEAIKRGSKLIYQGALVSEPWLGYPDFLVQADGSKAFQAEDAKLARKPKGEHVLQLGVYAELLSQLFGISVQDAVVHVATADPVSIDLRRTRYILKRLMRGFERFVAEDAKATKPLPCAACAQCDYKPRCEAEWRAADSPFYVAGVSGAQLVKLEGAGLRTLSQLADLAPTTKVDGMGSETVAKLVAQARLQREAKAKAAHSFELLPLARGRGFGMLPPPDGGDLYFDMEGDPLAGAGLEYLFGIFGELPDDSEATFHPIWGHTPAEEKAAFERAMDLFIEQMRRHPGAHIYHYAGYEPAALKRLAMRYATMEAELDQLLRERRFVDLYRVVTQALRASTESYSLKDLEAIYWRERAGEVKTAADSIVEYERWCISKDPAILESIAAYNKDDCVSTGQLHKWLESLRPAGARLEIVDESAPEKRDRSAERAALEAQKQRLAAAVRASGHGDARVRELVAELLWFHQRSQKPGWWAVFERQAWSEEELIEDPESLGGLRLDPNTRPVQVKQSMDTAYLFPPQDTKLKVGDTPKVAESIANAGTIMDFSAEDGRIVLRRGIKSGPIRGAVTRFSLSSIPRPKLAQITTLRPSPISPSISLIDNLRS